MKVVLRFLCFICEEDGAVLQAIVRTPWGCFMAYLLDRNAKLRVHPYHFDCVYGIELMGIELRWVSDGMAWLWRTD